MSEVGAPPAPAPAIALSVLDLAPVTEGSDAATAVRRAVALARHVEKLGYRRYWLAEHHLVAVAGSATSTLIGLVAAATDTIRVGSAAIQSGLHTPVSIVEAFGTIDALYPGRLDLGLGRSAQRRTELAGSIPPVVASTPQPDQVVDGLLIPAPFPVEALLGAPRIVAAFEAIQFDGATPPDFDDAVGDVLALLDGRFRYGDIGLSAVPGEGADVAVWIFGSSKGQSAQTAGARGLPFVANYHVSPSTVLEAVEAYRSAFRPSAVLAEPYVVVSADVVVAPDDATAVHRASTYGHWVHGIRSGAGAQPYPDPRTASPLDADARALVDDRIRTQFVGGPDTVVDGLRTLARVTGADELVITSVTHDFDHRLQSHELLARAWGLAGSPE
ncbi:LLM class flavin-dependent oxidoreductase [Gordonia desulfuricans]|uniref:LLM class flavin-dependent oxidoreductase n=1 Tax=Gordonia desulfuricans TaxID=89051 RepID=A0A7K3LQM3_9ACTN|nr:LLM class flavin-dependent oxidoreductase [Gordonia desulfuricans]NDK90564.1 LLM class flavin-dependent oxidoreductase [Gordonia desulfuricans]